MRLSTSLRVAAAAAATALVVTACGGGGGNGGDAGGQQGGGGNGGNGVLELGYVLPLTGQLAFLGPPQIKALEYAIQKINQAGGVLGKQIPAPVKGDEAGKKAVAVQSANKVLNAGVDALIGAAASGMSLAIIDKVTDSGVVQCSGSNTAPTFTDYEDGGFYFRTAPSDALQGPVLANTIIGDGHTRVALVARADDYGKGLMEATATALKEAGATVTMTQTYDPKTTNFAPLVQQIKGSNPDAAVVISFEEGTQILQGMIEAGIGPANIGVYGTDGLHNGDLPKLVAPNDPSKLAGMKGTAPASAENKEFISGLQEFAPNLTELQFAPQVFDCVMTIALAAEKAGTDNPAEFSKVMVDITKGGQKCGSFTDCTKLLEQGKNIDYQGASGPLDFIKAGEPGVASIEVYKFNEQGKMETVRVEQAKLEN